MNRNELAKEFNVSPCDVDDWLLLGCPARKMRREWEFEIEPVKIWLRSEKIAIKRINPRAFPKKPVFDQRWFGG
jgi:phage terminase Nu1 subunit (DNA packaging protein)